MGSKNLKAIALSGDRETSVAHPQEVEAHRRVAAAPQPGSVTDKYRLIGTVANLAVFNRLGTLPTRNFQQSTFEEADALSGETLTENNFSRRHGCASCTIRCERLFKSHGAGEEQRLEYETLFALGPLCGISDPEVRSRGGSSLRSLWTRRDQHRRHARVGDREREKGLLPEAARTRLALRPWRSASWRRFDAIAKREGVGALLAEGSRRAAIEIGRDSSDWAMQVKGLELPGYDPRSLKTMALGLAVSPRGACHNRSGAYEADFSGEVDRFHGDAGRGALVVASEDFAAVLDSLIVCKFLRKCFTDFYAEAAEMLAGVTGWDYTGAELRARGRANPHAEEDVQHPRALAARRRLAAGAVAERGAADRRRRRRRRCLQTNCERWCAATTRRDSGMRTDLFPSGRSTSWGLEWQWMKDIDAQ